MHKLFLSILLVFIFSEVSLAQISQGGIPESYKISGNNRNIDLVTLKSPDLQSLRQEDSAMDDAGSPPRVAVDVAVQKSIRNSGTWSVTNKGDSIWQLAISAPGALALSLSFSAFHLPAGGRLFIYNPDRTQLLGAFTAFNNKADNLFSTELVRGDTIIIEYDQDAHEIGLSEIEIASVGYAYRMVSPFDETNIRDGSCEVGINCPEGANWQDQKRGVARIYLKYGTSYFWCSGSLVNNTSLDRKPYFLTANHCAPSPSAQDLANWIFYFNYEAPDCAPPTVTPSSNTMNGASFISHAPLSGSDFLLLKLDNDVPVSYDPFYNGWDISGDVSPSGVGIHHPGGSSKKISTYTSPLISAKWEGIPGTHWQVTWVATESGHGVTEGGSSGSPIFDNNQRIVGTLTGGSSACIANSSTQTGPDEPDFYGKFSYSWDQNGNDPSQRLKDWLDPLNTGVRHLNGMNPQLRADFKTDADLILVNGEINYSDYSSGKPLSWKWIFEGGEPSEFNSQDPPPVKYKETGYFSTTLIVFDGIVSDTVVKDRLIEVVSRVYPNPSNGKFSIYLGDVAPEYVKAIMYNRLGQKTYEKEFKNNIERILSFDISNLSNGIYFVRLEFNGRFLMNTVSVIR